MNSKDFPTRPSGCTCKEPWQICEVCRNVPRSNGNNAKPVSNGKVTSSAQRLIDVIKDNVIPEQYLEFSKMLWSRWNGRHVTGKDAEAALSDLSEPDPDVMDRNTSDYPTRRM